MNDESPELLDSDNQDKPDFAFTIAIEEEQVVVQPVTVGNGLLPGGHARIRKRGTGRRRLHWTASQSFTIAFAELPSDAEIGSGGPGELFEAFGWELVGPPQWSYVGTLKPRSVLPRQTVAFKYKVVMGGLPLDPIIIVDR